MIKNKKLQINIVTLLLLCIGLCITSFAIAYVTISYEVKDNFFHTGVIDIDLNGDKPIIGGKDDANLLFAPGMTETRSFYIKNNGNGDVFYKLNFTDFVGDLADVLEIEIYKEEGSQKKVLLKGTISDIELSIADELKAGRTQYLFAQFHMPESADDNRYKNEVLQFDISAIAVQTKNNPSGDFK